MSTAHAVAGAHHPTDKVCLPDAWSITVANRLAGIARIFEPHVNAVVHARSLPAPLASCLPGVTPSMPLKCVVRRGDEAALRVLGLPAPLVEDLALWSSIVADLTDAPLVGVRLTTVEQPMCPRFHIDHVLVRIVVTYRGPGTEVLEASHADLRWLSPHHGGASDETSGLMRHAGGIYRASTGDVCVLKGEAWTSDVGGAVHRSPPTLVPRLVATFDALDEEA